jgi:D-3-phosphoglycerate dehydrogenase
VKALVLAPFAEDALEALNELVPAVHESWTETRRLYDPEELAERIDRDDVGVLIIEADFAFEELFENASALRFIGVCRQELNHVDVEAATQHGIVVVNTPARNAQAVAEHTIGLMLALARRTPQMHSYVSSQLWKDPTEPYISMRGMELGDKTLGIVGLGAIGRLVAKLARGIGMRVLAYDPYVGTMGERYRGTFLVSLEELLKESHFVTLHVPRHSETDGLLNAERLALVRPGSFLVNTSSYSAVDEGALVEALHSGRLAGAALDVHESHPIPPTSPLLGLDNVILTPHIGGATEETVSRHSWMIVEAVRRFLTGRRPKHLVNPAVWKVRRGR